MKRLQVMSKTRVSATEGYKVSYNHHKDTVVVEIGGTSLKLNVSNFILMNEMMRKAAARLVMQTKIE